MAEAIGHSALIGHAGYHFFDEGEVRMRSAPAQSNQEVWGDP